MNIGQILTVWEVEDGVLRPQISYDDFVTVVDATAESMPAEGAPVVVEVEAPAAWWDSIAAGMVLWRE